MQQLKPLARKKEVKILRPMFDRILIELVPPPVEKNALRAAQIAEANAVRLARVLAIGPGKLIAETGKFVTSGAVKAGDLIYINPLGGNKVSTPDDYDFVVEGVGSHGEPEFRCDILPDGSIEMNPEGQHLVLNSNTKQGFGYQLQTEDAVWMTIGTPGKA